MPKQTPDPEQHPDLPPDGFDEDMPSVEVFAQGLPEDLPDDVEPDDPADDAPVNPETPDEVLDGTLTQWGLPKLPSVGEGPVENQEEYGTFDPTDRPERVIEPTLRDEEGNALPSFDPKCREDFEGLLYLGALTKKFTWLGHKFQIRTINVAESIAVGKVTQAYDPTMSAALAMKTAFAAMCVMTVDGKELPIPYQAEDETEAWAFQRFDHVANNWFQVTIEAVFAEYLALEAKANAVVMAMGKAQGQPASTTG